METITADQLNFWMVELSATLSKQFNLDRSQLEQLVQKSARDLGIYKTNTIKTTTTTTISAPVVTREQVSLWFKPPAKGGLKIAELKQKAQELGIDARLKKEDLCEAFLKKLSVAGKEEQVTVQSVNTPKKTPMVICRHPSVKTWVVKGTQFAVKSPKELWVVGKIEGERVAELTFKDRAECHAKGWRLEKGAVEEDDQQLETVTVVEPVQQEYQVLDIEEEIEEENEGEDDEPEEDASDCD